MSSSVSLFFIQGNCAELQNDDTRGVWQLHEGKPNICIEAEGIHCLLRAAYGLTAVPNWKKNVFLSGAVICNCLHSV